MINGDSFISMLNLVENSSSILNMRKELDVPKPLIDADFKQYGGNSIPMKSMGIELFFKDSCKYTEKDKGVYGNGDVVFSGVVFSYNSKISAPLNLQMGDSYEVVVEKLGRSQDYDTKRFPQKVWKFTREDGEKYLLYGFFEKDYSALISLRISAYTPQVEKLIPHIS
ncbi:hypothetical protein JHD50_04095 [Sulfurimonas sp. MAG313]|nr:hypothetical protein [Sulfurimonas sp. MAG313]MDF1880492.1 hypothetical protein [Sulfurimonas sp. MAG313]